MNKPGLSVLRYVGVFVSLSQAFQEQTKTFALVFVFVFVLAHDRGHWTPATWQMRVSRLQDSNVFVRVWPRRKID